MKIVMTKTQNGASVPDGSASMRFMAGEEYTAQDWQIEMFKGFVARGCANEIGGNAAPKETKATTARKPRAQKDEG